VNGNDYACSVVLRATVNREGQEELGAYEMVKLVITDVGHP